MRQLERQQRALLNALQKKQKQLLIDLIIRNPEVAKDNMNAYKLKGKVTLQNKWEEFAKRLNSKGPTTKTPKERKNVILFCNKKVFLDTRKLF